MQVFPLTLDVKITKGGPKILEFQLAKSLSGYDALFKDLPERPSVTLEKELVELADSYEDENSFIFMLCNQKAFAALIAERSEIAGIMPEQTLLSGKIASEDVAKIAAKILDNISNPDSLIIKPNIGTVGRGFVVLSASRLEDFIRKYYCTSKDEGRDIKFDGEEFRYHEFTTIHELVIQQRCVSIPIDKNGDVIEEPTEKDIYFDPTVRFVMNVLISDEQISIEPKIGYWKYPISRVREGSLSIERIISDSSYYEARKYPPSNLVPNHLYDEITNELASSLQTFFERYCDMPQHELVEEILAQDSFLSTLAAINLIRHNRTCILTNDRDKVEVDELAQSKLDECANREGMPITEIESLRATPFDIVRAENNEAFGL